MKYRIPIGSEIIPFDTDQEVTGFGRHTSMAVDFDDIDSVRIDLPNDQGVPITYYSLPLGKNPTCYDRYLIRISDVRLLEG